jgi:hypothetical protein
MKIKTHTEAMIERIIARPTMYGSQETAEYMLLAFLESYAVIKYPDFTQCEIIETLQEAVQDTLNSYFGEASYPAHTQGLTSEAFSKYMDNLRRISYRKWDKVAGKRNTGHSSC